MKKQSIKNVVRYSANELPADIKTDWARVDALTNEELDKNARVDTDTLLADDEFWKMAQLVMPSDANKERITIRLDTDVLDWLKDQGKGYQSRINSILRVFMKTDQARHKGGSHKRIGH